MKYREISLSQGQKTKVSEKDYRYLSQFNWHARWNPHTRTFYAFRNMAVAKWRTTTVAMGREILGLHKGDGLIAEHKNGDTLDNRRENLRIATHSQNQHNRGRSRVSTTGYKGVYLRSDKQRFIAKICVNGVQKNLGSFDTPEEAFDAYCEAAKKEFGEFARFE